MKSHVVHSGLGSLLQWKALSLSYTRRVILGECIFIAPRTDDVTLFRLFIDCISYF